MEQRANLHVKKGDTVMIIAGKDKGKSGKILKVIPKKECVIVEKVNFIKRHQRPGGQSRQGGIIEREGPIHVSNIKIVCSKCNNVVRIKKLFLEDGKKVRVCSRCDEILDH
jgi:large subunit ribosomal protein L24